MIVDFVVAILEVVAVAQPAAQAPWPT